MHISKEETRGKGRRPACRRGEAARVTVKLARAERLGGDSQSAGHPWLQ
jgi:hypothetical protein